MAKKDFNITKQEFNNKSYVEKYITGDEEEKAVESPAKETGSNLSNEDIKAIREALEVLKSQPKKSTGRPKKPEEEKLGAYKCTLNFDYKIKRYLQNIAWQNRLSLAHYIRTLILDDMERYYKESKEKGIDHEKDWEEV